MNFHIQREKDMHNTTYSLIISDRERDNASFVPHLKVLYDEFKDAEEISEKLMGLSCLAEAIERAEKIAVEEGYDESK